MRKLVAPLFALVFALPGFAQTAEETETPPVVEAPADVAPEPQRDLAAFVAGAAEALRTREGIAGLVVAVVKDDRVLLTAGYGHASIEPAVPADAGQSLFRIGSVSKTFTYTATMQLIEQGKLALDNPVNDHLPEALRVPDDGYPDPIRVRHLLTHTAGYEDTALGHIFNRDPAREVTLDEYIVRDRPRRVRPPGAVASYSNYSIALLGAVVAHVSGVPFEDYIEQRLTGPLGMTEATFREPTRGMDAALAARVATGYDRHSGRFEPGWFEYIGHGAPAGSMSATAADMTRWMRVHLNEGTLDGATILTADSALRMREILHRNAPGVDGIAYGFLTERYGPYSAYGHGGATLYFHTAMVLVPELELGVFVSANTSSARQPVRDLARMIIEHIEPRARPTVAAIATDAQTLQPYVGAYRSNRRPYATVEKLLLTVGGDATISAAPDNSLRVQAGGETIRYVAVGPGLFQDADGNARLQFLSDDAGRVRGYTYGTGVTAADRIGPLDTINALVAVLFAAAIVALVRVVRAFRREPKTRHPARPGLTGVRALAVGAAVAWLAFLAVGTVAGLGIGALGNDIVHAYPTGALRIALALATLAALTTLAEVVALVPVWRSAWRAWPKVRYTLAVGVFALAVWVMWGWNLVGMKV